MAHDVLRDAIHAARSVWTYRTLRPTRTAGSSPEFVSAHSVRSEIRKTSAASRTVNSGESADCEAFGVIMFCTSILECRITPGPDLEVSSWPACRAVKVRDEFS